MVSYFIYNVHYSIQYSAILIFGYALDFLFTKQHKIVKRSQLPVEDVRLLLEMRLSAPAAAANSMLLPRRENEIFILRAKVKYSPTA